MILTARKATSERNRTRLTAHPPRSGSRAGPSSSGFACAGRISPPYGCSPPPDSPVRGSRRAGHGPDIRAIPTRKIRGLVGENDGATARSRAIGPGPVHQVAVEPDRGTGRGFQGQWSAELAALDIGIQAPEHPAVGASGQSAQAVATGKDPKAPVVAHGVIEVKLDARQAVEVRAAERPNTENPGARETASRPGA